jgi:hypothetical protein
VMKNSRNAIKVEDKGETWVDCDPAIPFLGIYPKECDTGYSRGTCTPRFIAALFTIAKLWK